jgi:hypothetical protein
MYTQKATFMCPHCQDKGMILTNTSVVVCNHCLQPDEVLEALHITIKKAVADSKFEFAFNLQAILAFLPEYPVIAVMEAEERNMDHFLTDTLRKTFQVMPFR